MAGDGFLLYLTGMIKIESSQNLKFWLKFEKDKEFPFFFFTHEGLNTYFAIMFLLVHLQK